MSAERLITEHLDLWTSAVTYNRDKPELTGIEKLRELILEIAIRGGLVEQSEDDVPAADVLERIEAERQRLSKYERIRKRRTSVPISDEEKEFSLPRGWVWTRLGDLVQMYNGRAFKKSEWSTSGIPIVRIANLNDPDAHYNRFEGEIDERNRIDSGDLLLSWSGSLGAFIWKKGEAAVNQHINKCVPFGELTERRFLRLAINARLKHLADQAHGIAMKHITKPMLESAVIALPPREEQRRIVERHDELMALCDHLEQQTSEHIGAHETLVDTLLETLTRSRDADELTENWARLADHFDTLFTTDHSIDRLEQTILQLAVMGCLVPQDPDDEPASNLLKQIENEKEIDYKSGKNKVPRYVTPVGEKERPFPIPKSWAWARIGHLTTQITDGVHKTPTYKKEGVPFISIKDIDGKTVTLDSAKFISEDEHRQINKRCNPEKNDILLCRIGTLGRPTIVDTDRPFSLFVSVGLLKYPTRCLLPKYFHLALKSPFLVDQYQAIKAGGSHTNKLNLGDIPKLVVPVPPYSEQQRIADKVSELIALCDRIKVQLGDVGKTECHLAETLVKRAVA